MKTREIVLGTAAIFCIGALSSAQIAPQGQRAPQPRSQQPRPDPIAGPVTTLDGCLYREDSILENYLLADATPAREQNRLPDRPIAEAGQPPAAPIAGLASGRMYKVTKIEDGRLKELVGKRVEVTGTIKPDTDAKPADRSTRTTLPNIEGTSIRELAGATCPATPR